MKLALFGGNPIVRNHTRLRIDWPPVGDDDWRAIKRVFDNKDFSGRGSREIIKLEELFSNRFNGMYATALNSGTAALHAALIALDIQPGDEVLIPSLTFVATATAVLYALAVPVFVDIDPIDYNISIKDLERKISNKTKAVIVVHLHGTPAKMDEILKICKKHNLKLVEDVAQAPGATYKGKAVGTFGDVSTFSLMSQKNLATCGECGILLTKTLEQKNKAERLRIYGEIINKNKPRIYSSYSLGWNYTLNPMQAAMVITQLNKFDQLTHEIQVRGRELTAKLKKYKWLQPPLEELGTTSVFHFYRIKFNPNFYPYKKIGRFRKAIQDILNAEGLNMRHYQNIPVSGQIIFSEKRAFGKGLPWVLNKRHINYDIKQYPNTLDVIRSTLVLGAISSSPGYLLCKGTIDKYIRGFEKIEKNMPEVIAYADRLDYKDPWETIPVTSDSFKAVYGIL